MSIVIKDTKNVQELTSFIHLPVVEFNNHEDVIKRHDEFWMAKILNPQQHKPFQWFLKRIIDYLGAMILLLMLFPVLAIVSLLILLDSRGPVIFKQKRLGFNGKEFYIYKFRSMEKDAELNLAKIKKFNETNDKMFKMAEDPRLTKVGKFIRRYSIDELPQLINVLKGEMSLVGFRPPIPNEVKNYENWHYVRFSTLPGLTGMWQVNGRSSIKDFDAVVRHEYDYIRNWTISLDIVLLFKTIPVVFLGKDAA